LTLRYVGYFYPGRTPEPLFLALHELLRQRPELSGRLRVEIVGTAPRSSLRTRAAKALPTGLVRLISPVDYRRSLLLMQSADLLLVVDPPADRSVYLRAKLIDYIGAERPIVAIAPSGPTADVVASLGGWVSDPADIGGSAGALASAIEFAGRLENTQPWGDPVVRHRFHVDTVGSQWRELLEEVHDETGPPGPSEQQKAM
jgi:hypothetical protein